MHNTTNNITGDFTYKVDFGCELDAKECITAIENFEELFYDNEKILAILNQLIHAVDSGIKQTIAIRDRKILAEAIEKLNMEELTMSCDNQLLEYALLCAINSDIACYNDEARLSPFNFHITRNLMSQCSGEAFSRLYARVRTYADFNRDNDPYGEHDFTFFDFNDEKCFFKIDYYNKSLTAYENPRSSSCRRVVTIGLAEDR